MVSKRETLEKAIAATADRGINYGRPEDNFDRIAQLWTVHLRNRYAGGYGGDTTISTPIITPDDVSMMMALMKIARLQNDPTHLDSWVDLAGYAACGAEIKASTSE